MAPKKGTTKKQKTGPSSSGTAPLPTSAQEKFISPAHFTRFKELAARRIFGEKDFDISPNGEYRQFVQAINEMNWGKLIDQRRFFNSELVREFYANALPMDHSQPFPFTTMVRGREISFDRDAINAYLGEPFTRANEDDLDQYHVKLAQGNWDVEAITQSLLLPGCRIINNSRGLPLRAKAEDMTPLARVALLFFLHNVWPRSHISDATMPILGLIHCFYNRTPVDIARIISKELKEIVLSDVNDRSRANCMLSFPGLIMGLIEQARVRVSSNHCDKLGKIDDRHVDRWCQPRRPIRVEHPPPPQPAPTQPTHRFTDQQLLYHIMDQNVANHRADVNLYEAMYRMSLHQPLYDPSHFLSQVAWPGDRPQFRDGAGTSGAAGDDDDDPIDEATADAFDDEGDGNDSMGD